MHSAAFDKSHHLFESAQLIARVSFQYSFNNIRFLYENKRKKFEYDLIGFLFCR